MNELKKKNSNVFDLFRNTLMLDQIHHREQPNI